MNNTTTPPSPTFTIDGNQCNRDGHCVVVCPTQVISWPYAQQPPLPRPDFAEFCLHCGHCLAVCPTGAFELSGLVTAESLSMDSDLKLTPNQGEQFLRSRRSVRAYRKQMVDRTDLKELLRLACYAPSAKNKQPWHWIVIQNPQETQEIAGMVIQWMRSDMETNPDPQIRRDRQRLVAAWERGEDRICRGAPHLIFVHGEADHKFGYHDTALALGYLELYAPLMGLGACWAGYVQSAVEVYAPLAAKLNLPTDHQIWGAMLVGYPKFTYHRSPPRRGPVVRWV